MSATDDILKAPFIMEFDNFMGYHETIEAPMEAALKTEPTFHTVEFDRAYHSAGDYTRLVLQAMSKHLLGTKRFIYVDSKIQFLHAGDAPVDSLHWHIDGCVYVPEEITRRLGYKQLHDVYARSVSRTHPTFLSLLTDDCSTTEYCRLPLKIEMPKCIEYFDVLDALVEAMSPEIVAQKPCQVVSFGARSLHRAVPAKRSGLRLWVRVTETDCRQETHEGVDYNTVFRLG